MKRILTLPVVLLALMLNASCNANELNSIEPSQITTPSEHTYVDDTRVVLEPLQLQKLDWPFEEYEYINFSTINVIGNTIYMGTTANGIDYYDLDKKQSYQKALPNTHSGELERILDDGYLFINYPYTALLVDKEMNIIKEVDFPPYTVPEGAESGLGRSMQISFSEDLNWAVYAQQYRIDDAAGEDILSGLQLYNTQTKTSTELTDTQSYYYNIDFLLHSNNEVFLYFIGNSDEDQPIMCSGIYHIDERQFELLERSESTIHHLISNQWDKSILRSGYYDKLNKVYHPRPENIPTDVLYIGRNNSFYYLNEEQQLCIYNSTSNSTEKCNLNSDFKSMSLKGISDNGTLVLVCSGSETMPNGIYCLEIDA